MSLSKSKFVAGDEVKASDMNEIVAGLIDGGYIQTPALTEAEFKALLDTDTRANAAIGWSVYYDAEASKVKYAAELPSGKEEALLGIVFDVTGSDENKEVMIMAPFGATLDMAHKDGYDCCKFSGVYATAVGSYDADGNKVEGEGTYTIAANNNSSNAKLDPSTDGFKNAFGTMPIKLRTKAMAKLGGFEAASACYKFTPKASLINLRGLWFLPCGSMLVAMHNNETTLKPACQKAGARPSWYYTWSCLELSSQYALNYNLSNDYMSNNYKNFYYSVLPVLSC